MSYSVVENDKGYYDILEKESSVMIRIDTPKRPDARNLCRKLNLGSGFCGWTPIFFAKLFTDEPF
jgi:hypothetical protein